MKHTLILPCLGLLSLASFAAAQDAADTTTTDDTPIVAQDDSSDLPPGSEDLIFTTAAVADATTVKPGTIANVTYQATVVNQNTVAASPVRFNYSMVTSRWGNKEILAYMAIKHDTVTAETPARPTNAAPYLPDGTVTGWSIVRLANALNNGNLYAVKKGKPAVAVPTFLLTAPTVTGLVRTGTTTFATDASVVSSSYTAKSYGTLTVNNGPATASGTQTIKTGPVKINGTSYTITTRSDNFTVIGQVAMLAGKTLAFGTVNSSFHMAAGTPVDLGATLLPGAATP